MQLLELNRPTEVTGANLAEDGLDQRIARIFEGNSSHVLDRLDRKEGIVSSQLDIHLALSWSATSQVNRGAFHPDNAYQCRSDADADHSMHEQLDVVIKDPAEAAALKDKWQSQALSLVAKHDTTIDVRQIPTRWYYHKACNACAGLGEAPCMTCHAGNMTCSQCAGRGGKQVILTGRTQPEWSYCPSCIGRGQVACYYCRGSRYVTCMGCYAKGYFTVVYDAKITAKVYVAHGFAGNNVDGAQAHVVMLPIETLLKQSELSPVRGKQGSGGVRFDALVRTAYHCRAYGIDRWTFDLCAVGRDSLIPAMPPILDLVLGELTDKLLSEADPSRIHALTSQSALTRDMLSAIGGQDGYDLAFVKRRYENAMSPELSEKVHATVQRGYDGIAGGVGRKIWLRNAIFLNLGLFLSYEVGLFSALVRWTMGPLGSSGQMLVLAFVAAALLGMTWLSAHARALGEAKKLISSDVTICPGMGWLPWGAVAATCVTVVYLSSAIDADYLKPHFVKNLHPTALTDYDAHGTKLKTGAAPSKL